MKSVLLTESSLQATEQVSLPLQHWAGLQAPGEGPGTAQPSHAVQLTLVQGSVQGSVQYNVQ